MPSLWRLWSALVLGMTLGCANPSTHGGTGGIGGSASPDDLLDAAADARRIVEITRSIPQLRADPGNLELLRAIGFSLPFAAGRLGTLGVGGLEGLRAVVAKIDSAPCWHQNENQLVYDAGSGGNGTEAECDLEIHVDGELNHGNDVFEIHLFFLEKDSSGTRNQHDGLLTIGDAILNGRLSIEALWDGGHFGHLDLRYDAIEVDADGCPIDGALLVEATLNNIPVRTIALFERECGAVTFRAFGHRQTCDGNDDCPDGHICDPFLEPKLCAALECVDEIDESCPTGYSCLDVYDDGCDPNESDVGCVGECRCGDACFPDECQNDADCSFGEACRGDYPTQCVVFRCGANAEFDQSCVPNAPDDCEFSFLGCPPEGSVCVDDPTTECELGSEPGCTGICVPPASE